MTLILSVVCMLLCLFGAVACAYCAQHARHGPSVHEPRKNAPLFHLAGAFMLGVTVFVGFRYVWERDADWRGLVAVMLISSIIVGAVFGRARENAQHRRKVSDRWNGHVQHLILLAVLFCGGGCSFVAGRGIIGIGFLTDVNAEIRPDGTVRYHKASQADFARELVGEAIRAAK